MDDTKILKISDAELEERLKTRDEFYLLVWDKKPRLSVAGVQAKINLVLVKEAYVRRIFFNLKSKNMLI